MTLQPDEEIGAEIHDDRDQFFRFEAGTSEVMMDETVYRVNADDAVIVPQGARHNVRCTGDEPLKMYTIYAPPQRVDGKVHQSCADGEGDDEHFDGRTTE